MKNCNKIRIKTVEIERKTVYLCLTIMLYNNRDQALERRSRFIGQFIGSMAGSHR